MHFIGDIHQPFHALGDDRGGNDIPVAFLGSSVCGTYNCNLHGVWDDMIIDEQGLSEKKYTDRLLQEIKDNHWERMAGGEPTTGPTSPHHYAVEPGPQWRADDPRVRRGGVKDCGRATGTRRSAACARAEPDSWSARASPATSHSCRCFPGQRAAALMANRQTRGSHLT